MLQLTRKHTIMHMLETQGSVSVAHLATHFQTSRETIRRDLRDFEQQGLLKRTHGGAVPVEAPLRTHSAQTPMLLETPLEIRRTHHTEEKQRICRAAAQFIQNRDVIYVDNSTTTIFLAHYIPRDIIVTVITNSIAFILETLTLSNPNIMLFCAPGFCNASNLSLYGNSTVKFVDEFYPGKAFFSCAGIFPDERIADSSLYETETKRAFIQKSEQVFLLADASKFNKTAPYFLADFSRVNYVITDRQEPSFMWQMLESKGVKLIVAE